MRSLIFALLAIGAGMVAIHGWLPLVWATVSSMVWAVGVLILWIVTEERAEERKQEWSQQSGWVQ